jgi:hypothetical protein
VSTPLLTRRSPVPGVINSGLMWILPQYPRRGGNEIADCEDQKRLRLLFATTEVARIASIFAAGIGLDACS